MLCHASLSIKTSFFKSDSYLRLEQYIEKILFLKLIFFDNNKTLRLITM